MRSKLLSWRGLAVGVAVLIGGMAALAAAVPDVRWRLDVIGLKLGGHLPEVPALDLARWLMPGSPVYLGQLNTHSTTAESGILNVFTDDAAYAKRGEEHYRRVCAACHGLEGGGGSAPSLQAFIERASDWAFFSTAKWGRKDTAMAPQPLSEREIWEVHSYLSVKGRAWAREAARKRASVAPKIDVPFTRLLNAAEHPEDWLMYSGDLLAHRHSRLDQINRHNVHNLRVAWAAQLRPATKPLAATPLVVNGIMFVTEAPDGVVALDARNGRELWRFTRAIDASKLPVCCGAFNRGVAVLGSRVFVATLDAWLIALDAATGRRLWEVQVADYRAGYSMTTAPLVLDGQVVVGVAGGETGIRGFLAAFSVADGKRLWQFDTVPGPGQPGHDTWAGDSWKTGGASTWSLGAYDPKLDILYWSTGNPWPPFDNRSRQGDNLYSNSIIALAPKTGKLLWHFQLTPADVHDWDATQQLILADITWQGEKIPAALMASRNAFYYALDRRTGKFLYGRPFVKQTWAKGLDAKGHPIREPDTLPTEDGNLVYPWLHGGTNWWPPSYDAKRHLHFVPTVDAATLYFRVDQKLKPGTMTMRGTTLLATNRPAVMAVKALDPDTGAERWATRLDQGDFHQYARITGLLSTDGGLVFAGFMERLSILDADNGKELWTFRPGALVNAGPAAYAIDGVQYFAIIAGNVLYAFSLPPHEAPAAASAAAPPAGR
ncbi:MAG: PQQ-binding-like beta-propeller repeat protein [Burkholderiaceae bacterium]|nr:PQQ-binding-like beta-propeller repeat protein [Burkholderiaceae bacterium]